MSSHRNSAVSGSKFNIMSHYKITDQVPKEGDYGINPDASNIEPRLVERISETNGRLGMRLSPSSLFKWMPLRDHHRKVVFDEKD